MDWKARYHASIAARSFIMSAVAKAYGWPESIGSIEGCRSLGEHVYLYCADIDSGALWMEMQSHQDFIGSMLRSYSNQGQWDIARTALNFALLINGTISPRKWSNSTEPLGPLIAAYVGTTGLALDADQIPPGSHLVVLRYPNNPKDMPVRLCLAELKDASGMMDLKMAKEVVQRITEDDRGANPAWFEK